jgi:hypothetical protein
MFSKVFNCSNPAKRISFQPVRKIVSMVSEIKYAGRFDFEAGKEVEINYTVKVA